MSARTVPDELLQEIFCRLPVRYHGIVARVCKRWREVDSDDIVWMKLAQSEFRISTSNETEQKNAAECGGWRAFVKQFDFLRGFSKSISCKGTEVTLGWGSFREHGCYGSWDGDIRSSISLCNVMMLMPSTHCRDPRLTGPLSARKFSAGDATHLWASNHNDSDLSHDVPTRKNYRGALLLELISVPLCIALILSLRFSVFGYRLQNRGYPATRSSMYERADEAFVGPPHCWRD